MKAKTVVCPLALLLAILSLASFAGVAQASSTFHEGWESEWILLGTASRDCTTSCTGKCSLKIAPLPNVRASATRSETVSLTGRTRASFQFRASSTLGDTDTNFRLRFSDGTNLFLHMTQGWAPNNRVSFYVDGGGSHLSFASWSASACHGASIVIDPNLCVAWGELNGVQSNHLAIPCSATTISSLEIDGDSWSASTATFWYDEIDVAPEP